MAKKPQGSELDRKYRVNEQIKSSELLVISPSGEKLGVLPRDQALAEARSAELDLVELGASAKPPVAKIISWSKFKYDQSKKKKSSKTKSQEQKEIWFKAFIGQGDIDHKLRKVEEFIEKKHNVRLTIKRRGRVSYENMKDLMDRLLDQTSEFASVLMEPKLSGPNFSAVIGPKK